MTKEIDPIEEYQTAVAALNDKKEAAISAAKKRVFLAKKLLKDEQKMVRKLKGKTGAVSTGKGNRKPRTPEQRKKISDAQKASWKRRKAAGGGAKKGKNNAGTVSRIRPDSQS